MAASLASGQVPQLAPGAHLKVDRLDGPRIEGTLMSQSNDTLTIAAEGAVITPVAAAAVGRIKASAGKSHGAGAKKGAKIGAVIGGGFGLLTGLLYDNADIGFNGSQAPILFGVVGAAEGAIYGVLIGAIVRAQKWTTVYERPYGVTAGFDGNRASAGLSIRF